MSESSTVVIPPKLIAFEKFVDYISMLDKYYKEKLGYSIPCFNDYMAAFNVTKIFGGNTLTQRKKNMFVLYGWLREHVKHVKTLEDCVKYCHLFVEHRSGMYKISADLIEKEHMDEFVNLFWTNICNERDSRK